MANIRKPVNSKTETKIRSSLFDRRDRLAFHKNPQYYMQWVNDVRDEVQRYLDAGFVFVSEDERWGKETNIDVGANLDSRAAVNVGRAGGQENVVAYLMKIPKDEWEELIAPLKEEAMRPLQELKNTNEQLKQNEDFYDVSNRKLK